MEHNNERIVKLIYRRLKGLPLTVEENQEVDAWLNRSESNRKTFQNLSDEEWLKDARKKYYAPGKEAGLAQLREQLFAETPVRRLRRVWYAAASVLLIISVAGYLLLRGPTKQEQPVLVSNELKDQLYITPGGEAILTLSNGLKIPFRNKANGLLENLENGKQLYKQDGKLVYQFAMAQSSAGGVDTTIDPRDDQYSVVLSDGSRVWLNRGTTLRYPQKFDSDKRIVELNGEAYFEIAKVAKANGQGRLPFIVKMAPRPGSDLPTTEVEVLGTHFNIYAHQGEPIRTTLTEGSITMTRGDDKQLLRPGEQATLDSLETDHIRITDDISTTDVLSWKDYKYSFHNVPLDIIMKELKRWYDIKSYGWLGNPKAPFTLICDRNKPLSETLNQLTLNGKPVRITMGDDIVIAP